MQMRVMSGDPIILTSTLNNFHGVQNKIEERKQICLEQRKVYHKGQAKENR